MSIFISFESEVHNIYEPEFSSGNVTPRVKERKEYSFHLEDYVIDFEEGTDKLKSYYKIPMQIFKEKIQNDFKFNFLYSFCIKYFTFS